MNEHIALKLAETDESYVAVAWGLYVRTSILMHDTPALARYYVKHCQENDRETTALTTYYQHLDLWFNFPDQLRKHRELIAGLFRCIRFTTVRLDMPIFPIEERELYALALRRELDEVYDFLEWCEQAGSVLKTEMRVLTKIINRGHTKLDRLVLA